ncbi:hypothetical protein DICVIV_07471, partial [Dictyocaulus viviparus]
KIIYDYYTNLFGSHVRLPPCNERKDDYVVPNVLPSEIRHAISSVRNRTAPGPDRIRPEHLKNLPPVIIKTLARLFIRYLSDCKVPSQWKTSRTVIGRRLDEEQPREQAGFRKGFSTMDHIHTIRRLIEVSREYKKPLCLTSIDLKKAFDCVKTEAVMEALTNQALPASYIILYLPRVMLGVSRITQMKEGIRVSNLRQR